VTQNENPLSSWPHLDDAQGASSNDARAPSGAPQQEAPEPANTLEAFLGGSPGAVALKLVLMSLVVGALMIGILGLTLTLLQQRFDQGDYERAILLLAAKAPTDQVSINEEMVRRAGATPVECQPRLLSSFRGTLEVTCRTGKSEPYRFEVDLVRKAVQPQDAATRELMDAVAARNKAGPALR